MSTNSAGPCALPLLTRSTDLLSRPHPWVPFCTEGQIGGAVHPSSHLSGHGRLFLLHTARRQGARRFRSRTNLRRLAARRCKARHGRKAGVGTFGRRGMPVNAPVLLQQVCLDEELAEILETPRRQLRACRRRSVVRDVRYCELL